MADLTDLVTVKTYMGITGVAKDALLNQLIPAVSRQIERYCGRIFHMTVHKGKVWSAGGDVLYLPNYPVRELRRLMRSDKYVLKVLNTSSDALLATVQVAIAEDGSYTMYLNIVGGVNESNGAIDMDALVLDTIAQLKTVVEALGLGWQLTIVGGCEGYPATELLDFAGEPCLSPEAHDCYVPFDFMTDLYVEETQGRVKTKLGYFPNDRYVHVEYKAGYDVIPPDLEMLATKIVADTSRMAGKNMTLKSEKLGDYSWTAGDSKVVVATVIDKYSEELVRWKRIAIG